MHRAPNSQDPGKCVSVLKRPSHRCIEERLNGVGAAPCCGRVRHSLEVKVEADGLEDEALNRNQVRAMRFLPLQVERVSRWS